MVRYLYRGPFQIIIFKEGFDLASGVRRIEKTWHRSEASLRLCAKREIKNTTLFEMKMNFLFSTPTNSQLFSKSVSLLLISLIVEVSDITFAPLSKSV